jgi:hypothetical protein
VLAAKGIDLILGMTWLRKYKVNIQCVEKVVSLTAPSGDRIEVKVSMMLNSQGTVYHLNSATIEDIKVVNEFPDIFPDDLPGMPPDHEIEFIIDLLPGTAPIAK